MYDSAKSQFLLEKSGAKISFPLFPHNFSNEKGHFCFKWRFFSEFKLKISVLLLLCLQN